MIRRLWAYRQLVLSLVRRQYQLRYRQSLVGIHMGDLPPLASLLVATVVFHGVIGVDSPAGRSYPLFTLAALTPWTFFARGLRSGIPSIVTSMQMVTRLPFPRASLPLSMIGTDVDRSRDLRWLRSSSSPSSPGTASRATAVWFPLILRPRDPAHRRRRPVDERAERVHPRYPHRGAIGHATLALPHPRHVFPRVGSGRAPTALPREPDDGDRRGVPGGLGDTVARRASSCSSPPLIGAVVMLAAGISYFSATESRFADAV